MASAETIRLDKWLWQARFFKSRSLSAAAVAEGHLRVNSQPVSRGAHPLKIGDVLTFPQGTEVRVIRVLSLGLRRGPASEAQALYLNVMKGDSASHPLA